MKRFGICGFSIVMLFIGFSCESAKTDQISDPGKEIEIRYAKGFSIFETSDGYRLEVNRPFPGAKAKLIYLLTEKKDVNTKDRVIQLPVKSIVCTSTTHLPMLDYLNETDRLVGFPTTDYISTPSIRKRIDEGQVKELGSVLEMNIESLLEEDPDLIVNYSMDDLKKTNKLEALGFTVLINGDYLEDHPLGRAEWIKVFGLFTGKFEMADSIFNGIESAYLNAMNLAKESSFPCVFSGSMYGDAWFMPGGNNYAAKLLKDAGYSYAAGSDSSYGFLRWGYENVFEMARECEYWLSPAPFPNLEALGNADERYREFTAFRESNVYVYDKRQGPTGGNEYLELGYLRPDIILKDLIKIRDGKALPDHDLYFYRKLK